MMWGFAISCFLGYIVGYHWGASLFNTKIIRFQNIPEGMHQCTHCSNYILRYQDVTNDDKKNS